LEAQLLHDCLGGTIVEVALPRSVTIADLDRVEGVVTREILTELPRPFYRLDVPGRFLATGIVGEAKIRFTVRRALSARASEIALDAARTIMRP